MPSQILSAYLVRLTDTAATEPVALSGPGQRSLLVIVLTVGLTIFSVAGWVKLVTAPAIAAAASDATTSSVAADAALPFEAPSTAPNSVLTKSAPQAPQASSPQTGTAYPAIPVAPYDTYPNTYDAGQCTWYVAGRRQVPAYWGNANQWYYRAEEASWSVGTTPRLGAIAWTDAGYYGHVAIVEGISANGEEVEVTEMNFYGPYVRDDRWTNVSAFKYIY